MIRLAKKTDTQRIGELWLAMVDYHESLGSGMPQASENGAKYYEQGIISRLHDPMTRILVAEVDGEVVGYVLGMIVDLVPDMFKPVKSGFLADIFVMANHRRMGVGRQLVERLMMWFHAHDITYFEWHVASRNLDAVAFWESIGGQSTMLRMRLDIEGDNP